MKRAQEVLKQEKRAGVESPLGQWRTTMPSAGVVLVEPLRGKHVARRIHADRTRSTGTDESHGRSFSAKFLKEVCRRRPLSLPYAVLHLTAKWSGYRLGAMCIKAPDWVKKMCSGQDYYWTSNDYREGRSP